MKKTQTKAQGKLPTAVPREATTPASDESGEFTVSGGATGELTREINRNLILERIRELQPISRVDLARASGLQPSTVSSIVEQLLGEGWIRESALVRRARGRHPTLLSLSDEMVIFTADVRSSHATVALVDLHGRFLEWRNAPLGKDPAQGAAKIAEVMALFREQHSTKRFEGVGISMPGRIDPSDNRLLMAPNLPWLGYDLQGDLSKRLDMNVEIDNAANACLLSELWFGQIRGARNAVLITVSEGIGGAILSEGRIVTGSQGMAGEFGHICLDLEGLQCGCGQRGCWETVASSRALVRYHREFDPGSDKLTPTEIVSRALDGNQAALSALSRQIENIARGLHLLSAIVSPDLILFAGDVAAYWSLCAPVFAKEILSSVMAGEAPEIRCLGDGQMERLRGAAAVVLRRHSGYYQSSHHRSVY